MENKDEILEIDQQWQTNHEKLLERCFWGTDNYDCKGFCGCVLFEKHTFDISREVREILK